MSKKTSKSLSDLNRPRRIAIFSDSLPERNGVSAYWHDLIPQVEPKLNKVQLFQPLEKRRFLQFAVPLPGDPTQKIITPNIFRIWRQYMKLNPDLVIAVSPGPFGLLGLVFAQMTHKEFATVFHTHFEAAVKLYWNKFKYHLTHGILMNVNRILCERSNTVFVTNSDLISIVKKLKAKEVEVVGTPVAPIFLNTPVTPPEPKLKRVLFAGRLAPEKNLGAIIKAAIKLPDIEFIIIGEGPLWKQVKKRTARLPNLTLKGWLKRDELIKEFDKAQLLLLPSHEETFGTVALEAMARGRPALVSHAAGIHDWKVLKGALFVINPDENVATKLESLMEKSPEFWSDVSEKSRLAAEALNNHTINQWIDCIHHITKNPDRRNV